MKIIMNARLAGHCHNGSQRARIITETWGETNLYCPNCTQSHLTRLGNNAKVSDYHCTHCNLFYQLKSQKKPLGKQVAGASYSAMIAALRNNSTPNFYFLQYDIATWRVKNLLLIPSFAFPESAIIKRKPLSATHPQPGLVMCNISLVQIPVEARIAVIIDHHVVPAATVREKYHRLKPLAALPTQKRGWTLDVLNAIHTLGQSEFTNDDAYRLVPKLQAIYPGNHYIKDKIRQQLQVLRDSGLLIHRARSLWQFPHPQLK
jgi:type II restriction enzyme